MRAISAFFGNEVRPAVSAILRNEANLSATNDGYCAGRVFLGLLDTIEAGVQRGLDLARRFIRIRCRPTGVFSPGYSDGGPTHAVIGCVAVSTKRRLYSEMIGLSIV